MFRKILIANRGEIACRIIRTARRLGIATVAVHSDADRDAVHVREADEAVAIGPALASQSYLLPETILSACQATCAEAVHPGYGFLSERASFCEMLEQNGIVFIGPKPRAIRAMGDKIQSKLFAREAGVSIVPGHLGIIDDAKEAVRIAADIGYPVMIKASAGGGGKGMRIAWNAEEARDGFERARSEAKSSFGDDRVFIEKFIEEPRHIEIQVLADAHGKAIHLGERECSIQRRNQKVVEEAPSPFLDAATRKAMGEQSVALAKAVDYQSAATVEFIVDRDRNFYFLEMNTRLQVEHPVTELVTGIDLVEEMLRIAAGEPLRIAQGDVRLDGWAIESRIYAEDPYRNFLPSTGRLTRYRPPAEGPVDGSAPQGAGPGGRDIGGGGAVIRNDTGVTEGSEISMFYDPMIAKLCTWAPSRAAATDAMAEALDGFVVDGIGHNVPFVAAIMRHPRWRKGDISTRFIADEYPEGFSGGEASEETLGRLAGLAALLDLRARRRRLGIPAVGERLGFGIADNRCKVVLGGREFAVTSGEGDLRVDGLPLGPVRLDWRRGGLLARIAFDGAGMTVRVDPAGTGFRLRHGGLDLDAKVHAEHVAPLARLMPRKAPPDTSAQLLCPMPGLLVALAVKEGAVVEEGQTLAVVEAMKMENVLRAKRRATVKAVLVKQGDSLTVDATILEFET